MDKLKLLVVDDEEEIRKVIRFFGAPQYDVFEAANGSEALELLGQQKVDLVISDYNMPKMDGLELLKILSERGMTVPVIWLTGRGSAELCRDSWALGVYDYMEKPFDPEQLMTCLSGAADFARSLGMVKGMDSVSRQLFEKAQLMLGARSYRAFQQVCMKQGISPSSMIERLIEDYLKSSHV